MTADKTTVNVYDRLAGEYADMADATPDPSLDGFLARLPAEADILDIGCGPGTASARFVAAGHHVTAIDPSAEMAAIAKARFDLDVATGTFADVRGENRFDAIWASFSLLHAPRAEMPSHLARFHKALRADGVLFVGLKEGDGEKRDRIGRLYTYYREDELLTLLSEAGFTPGPVTHGEGKGLDGTMAPFLAVFANA